MNTSESLTNVSHFSVIGSDSVRLHWVTLNSYRYIAIRVLGTPLEVFVSCDLSPSYSPRREPSYIGVGVYLRETRLLTRCLRMTE